MSNKRKELILHAVEVASRGKPLLHSDSRSSAAQRYYSTLCSVWTIRIVCRNRIFNSIAMQWKTNSIHSLNDLCEWLSIIFFISIHRLIHARTQNGRGKTVTHQEKTANKYFFLVLWHMKETTLSAPLIAANTMAAYNSFVLLCINTQTKEYYSFSKAKHNWTNYLLFIAITIEWKNI